MYVSSTVVDYLCNVVWVRKFFFRLASLSHSLLGRCFGSLSLVLISLRIIYVLEQAGVKKVSGLDLLKCYVLRCCSSGRRCNLEEHCIALRHRYGFKVYKMELYGQPLVRTS